MHIVLLEPEIPQNAGNIARTCAVTNSVLHLIKPLGFSVEDKYLKRAGLDYWKLLDIRYYENFEDFCERNPNAKIWMASTKARHIYADVTYGENDYIMFGKESAGIPEEILMAHEANTIRIPMLEAARSLNLSNSVAIIIYEAMRQQGFPGMLMVLSGMSTPEQVQDNISFMKDFKPLGETELAAIAKVQEIFRSKNLIQCTGCRYCTDGCPKQIAIPELFATMNAKQIYHDWHTDYYYHAVYALPGHKASDCVKCGKCESVCPQHLPIRQLLENVAKEFEKKEA